jgi:dolichol-phosphate mannosyltransferase
MEGRRGAGFAPFAVCSGRLLDREQLNDRGRALVGEAGLDAANFVGKASEVNPAIQRAPRSRSQDFDSYPPLLLVVVLPTYNEAAGLAQVVGALLSLELPGLEVRLLIVDDDSPDGTGPLADTLSKRASGRISVLHRVGKRGLGSAYVEAFARAIADGADLIAQMDADLSHDPAALATMVTAIGDSDVVIGSRYMRGGGIDTDWNFIRKLLSWLANRAVVPFLLSLPISDATGGYRLWRRDALVRIAPATTVRSSGYGFQVEMACLAHHLGCRIREVPIYFRERELGKSKMSKWVAVAAVREILTIRLRRGRAVNS